MSYKILLAAGSALMITDAALAQRSGENVLRSAQDAFGSSIGNESIGIYSPTNVRGFSPFTAGNVRLEGLYFDPVVSFNTRLVRGSSVRVGISAQGYVFPAPTGIADFRLRVPGDDPAASAVLAVDSFGTTSAEVDAQTPLVSGKLALGIGGHISQDEFSYGGSGAHRSGAAILHWTPSDSLEVMPFWSGFTHDEMGILPTLIGSGTALPPRIDRRRNITQPWSDYSGDDVNYGAIVRWGAADTKLSAGIFRSVAKAKSQSSEIFADILPDGTARQHLLSKGPGRKSASTSGEIRLSHSMLEGPRLHMVHLSVRARDNQRRYGGMSSTDVGEADIDTIDVLPSPTFVFGSQSRDHVEQLSAGIAYEGRWADVGELTLGLQRTDYRKTVRIPQRPVLETKASPALFNAGLALQLSPELSAYGGYTRSLEESPVSPSFAINRDEAPPAILTRQQDVGLRWALNPAIRLVAGLFNVEKPYYSVDDTGLFRRLGDVRHRGAEMSLVGRISPNFNVIAGAVLLDARVSGEAYDADLIGKRPVRSTGQTLLFSTDYRPSFVQGLSVDLGVNYSGKRAANSSNSLFVPATAVVNAGARYNFKMNGIPMSVRLLASNLLNDYSWDVQGSNAFFYSSPRNVSLRFTADL